MSLLDLIFPIEDWVPVVHVS